MQTKCESKWIRTVVAHVLINFETQFHPFANQVRQLPQIAATIAGTNTVMVPSWASADHWSHIATTNSVKQLAGGVAHSVRKATPGSTLRPRRARNYDAANAATAQ